MRIYSINKTYKPFTDKVSLNYLQSKGITYTSKILTSDILLSSSTNSKIFKIFKILFFWKKFLVYTNEPREDYSFNNFEKKNLIIMNVYSGNVFFNNLHFLGSYHYDFTNNLGIPFNKNQIQNKTSNYQKEKNCAAIFGYKNPNQSTLFKNNEDISLNAYRQNLAIFLNSKGKCDIIGGGWPNTIEVIEESGFESGGQTWWDRKISLLKNYKFNICIENTAYPYYCTEKLWHAIASGCLPIYYGKNTAIYDTFNDNSFIDASTFNTFEELYTFLNEMSESEYSERFENCKKIMLKSLLNKQHANKMEILDRFILNMKKLTN
ncbi:glycosyltransferase family 10 domain-containing protein [Maribacter stanieri]|uniref:glycosyltransferase family 10 domain-containing protein n=1 Tax=Maribacter stanieri TaxID=440514 RepID=UPI002493D3C6|nr:glycosyltransferase family 10 [Maribacter stanieri]